MHAATPSHSLIAFILIQTLFQHEVFDIYINTERRLTLLASGEPWRHVDVFLIFWTKGIK